MATQRPFRFGISTRNAKTREEWISKARRIEDLGYSILLVPEHLDREVAPVAALMAAAGATTMLRVGSMVFANDYRHPAMLAREVATIDVMSGGRFELGLGIGYLAKEYEQMGIPFERTGVRLERLEESIQIMKGLFAEGELTFQGKHYTVKGLNGLPKPIQRPHPPVYMGGGGRLVLSAAARHANIIGIGPKVKTDGHMDMADASAEATEQKIAWIRQAAGDRFDEIELNLFIIAAAVTHDRQLAASQVAGRFGAVGEQILDTPHSLVGSVEEICDQLWERRERYGFSYIVAQESRLETLAPVVARLAGK